MSKIACTEMDKESFREWILACCDTFLREEDKLYALYNKGTIGIDIIFPLRVDEVAKMEIVVNKIVQNNEEKVLVIKSLEDKEKKENEISNENEQ